MQNIRTLKRNLIIPESSLPDLRILRISGIIPLESRVQVASGRRWIEDTIEAMRFQLSVSLDPNFFRNLLLRAFQLASIYDLCGGKSQNKTLHKSSVSLGDRMKYLNFAFKNRF